MAAAAASVYFAGVVIVVWGGQVILIRAGSPSGWMSSIVMVSHSRPYPSGFDHGRPKHSSCLGSAVTASGHRFLPSLPRGS
jgi:hypothetical protein